MLAGLIAAVIFAVLKDIIVSAIKALGKMVFDMWRNRRKQASQLNLLYARTKKRLKLLTLTGLSLSLCVMYTELFRMLQCTYQNRSDRESWELQFLWLFSLYLYDNIYDDKFIYKLILFIHRVNNLLSCISHDDFRSPIPLSGLHNHSYTECQYYQRLTADCSVSQIHKVISAPLGHFTCAQSGQISQSIPISPQTAQGVLKDTLVPHHR